MFHWRTNMQKREITVLYRRLQYGEWFEILHGKEESFAGNFIKSSGSECSSKQEERQKQSKRRLMPLESVGVLITNIKMTFSRFMKRFRERQLPL